ncbi:MAG: ADP-ribosylglycohydrolase family protein [Planctomycetota bacterium]|nr:MAG: ADP-ribosylglycohydrolase family protein [Planctomycetota bacterium]
MSDKGKDFVMKKMLLLAVLSVVVFVGCVERKDQEQRSTQFRRISVDEYLDKMKGGWVGQMAGVGWGGPTEFKWKGKIMPAEKMPKWTPERINQFGQDDIYVEMTFIRTLQQYGFDVDIRQAGIDFANSGYGLAHANHYGRDNLRKGIAPPDSGHPKFTDHADDIDYQIEADYSGLIAPGMPNLVIELGEKFGRLMNYGDGLYGGQFVGGMYAEAFFEKDMQKIVHAGLACIPAGSQYAECIRDVIKWHSENPDNWQKTWHLIEAKYQDNPDYRMASCDKGNFNIDAKINGAYIVMGLLYGEGDIDKTITISTRCGQDSDCNPSNAAGVLCTMIGFKNLPDKFKSALDPNGKFSHSPYTFPKMIEVSAQLVRDAVIRQGGRIEKDQDGKEVFVIAAQTPKPSKLEQCWAPGAIAGSKFTDAEMKKIKYSAAFPTGKIFPGWRIIDCGKKMNPGLRDAFGGKKNVIVTYPVDRETGSKISGRISIPKNKKTTLALVVGHHPKGDWDLIVKLKHGKELFRTPVGKDTAKDGWLETEVDLSEFAGKRARIELVNQSNGGEYEAAYWAKIDIVSE